MSTSPRQCVAAATLLRLFLRGAAVQLRGRRRNHVRGRTHACDAALQHGAERDAVFPHHHRIVQKFLWNQVLVVASGADQAALEDVRGQDSLSRNRLKDLDSVLPQKLVADVPGDESGRTLCGFSLVRNRSCSSHLYPTCR